MRGNTPASMNETSEFIVYSKPPDELVQPGESLVEHKARLQEQELRRRNPGAVEVHLREEQLRLRSTVFNEVY